MEKELVWKMVQGQIGYDFKNLDLLQQAFTRRSYTAENGGENNEVLEFIGDKALDFMVVKLLIQKYGYLANGDPVDGTKLSAWEQEFKRNQEGYEAPAVNSFGCDYDEDDLSKIKSRMVNKKALARRMDELGFSEHLIMGKGDIQNNINQEDSVKEDLMDLWSRVQALHPDIKFQIVPFENTPENAREILANLGKNIDIVGGIFDETMLHLRGCAGLELTRGRFCCAVSIHHRLADKDKLQVSDLYGENLLLMHRGWSHYVDQLRDDLWQHHPQIHIVDFDFYNMDVFNRCENTNDVLLAIPGWATVHPLLKIIPVEWNYSIPYGILHSPEPTPTVQRFLDAAKIISKELYG